MKWNGGQLRLIPKVLTVKHSVHQSGLLRHLCHISFTPPAAFGAGVGSCPALSVDLDGISRVKKVEDVHVHVT